MSWFSESGLLPLLFFAALGVTVVILLRRTYRYLSRQKDDSFLVRTRRPPQEDRGHHLDAPPAVLRWEVEMHETARELSAQLDSKMSALGALISEADRAAARLEAAVARASEPLGTLPTHQADALGEPSESPGSGNALPTTSSARRQEEIYTLADYGHDAVEIAARLGSPVGEVELILGLREKK